MIRNAAVTLLISSTSLATSEPSWPYPEPKHCVFLIESLEPTKPRTLKAELELYPRTDDGRKVFDARLTVHLNDELLQEKSFENLEPVWDGHSSGLITAPGFAFSYSNVFGLIHNPLLIAWSRFGSSESDKLIVWTDGRCISSGGTW